MDSKKKGSAAAVKAPIERELSALMERRRSRGMEGAAIRVMVVGIPNVGKIDVHQLFRGNGAGQGGQ